MYNNNNYLLLFYYLNHFVDIYYNFFIIVYTLLKDKFSSLILGNFTYLSISIDRRNYCKSYQICDIYFPIKYVFLD